VHGGAPGDLPFKRTGLDAAGGLLQTDWMTHIVLFPSVLGVRQGVHDAAQVLREAGHEVLVVDLYGGRVFDDYDKASTYEESIGYPELMRRAGAAVEAVPDGFIAAGFSNEAAMAEYVATQRPVDGVLMFSGALDITMLGADTWPDRYEFHFQRGCPAAIESERDHLAQRTVRRRQDDCRPRNL